MKDWWTMQRGGPWSGLGWYRRPGHRLRLGSGVLLILVAAVPVRATEVMVRTADGVEGVGVLVSFSLAEGLEWQPGGSPTVRVESEEVVRITAYDRRVRAPASGVLVYLHGGGRLFGLLGEGDEEGLVLENPLWGRLALPLERVAAVVTEGGRDKLSPAGVRAALGRKDRKVDELWFANGDRLSGSLVAINGRRVMLDTELGESETPAKFLWGVFLAAASPAAAREQRLRAMLRLTDGSELPAEKLRWMGQEVQVAGQGWGGLSLAARHLAGVDVLGGRWRWLGELAPTEYTQTSLAGVRWPYRVDANVLDEPMRIGGQTYARGIGVHGAARLVYYLGGEYETFRARVGIDDSAGRYADADFEVLVDSRTAFRTRSLSVGDAPVPVRVDIAGAQRLEIVVDLGRNADIQDRVNLAEAALVRKHATADASPLP